MERVDINEVKNMKHWQGLNGVQIKFLKQKELKKTLAHFSEF